MFHESLETITFWHFMGWIGICTLVWWLYVAIRHLWDEHQYNKHEATRRNNQDLMDSQWWDE